MEEKPMDNSKIENTSIENGKSGMPRVLKMAHWFSNFGCSWVWRMVVGK